MMSKRQVTYYKRLNSFLKGCCIPTSSLLWMIIVFFIFIILISLCGCLAIVFTRLYYKWKASRRLDIDQRRRREEEENRRLEAFRKKQLEIQLLTRAPSKDCETPHPPYVALPPGMTPPSQYYWDRFNTARLPDADSDKRFGNKAQNEGEKMRRVDSGKKGSSDLCDEGKSKEDRKETSVDLPETSKKLKSAENLKGVLEKLEEKTALAPSESVTGRSSSLYSNRRVSPHDSLHQRSNSRKRSLREKSERSKSERSSVQRHSKHTSKSPPAKVSKRRGSKRKSSKPSSESPSSKRTRSHRRRQHEQRKRARRDIRSHHSKRRRRTTSSHRRSHKRRAKHKKLRHSKLSSSVPTETNRTESESTEPQQSSRKRRRSEYKIDAFKTSGFIEHMARGKKKIRQARPNPNLLLIASEAPLTQLPIESRVGMSSGANSGMYTQSIPDKSRNNKRSLEPSLDITQSPTPRNIAPMVSSRRAEPTPLRTEPTQRETPILSNLNNELRTIPRTTQPSSSETTQSNSRSMITSAMLNIPPISPFLGDNLYWTTTTNRKMHIQPENSPQSGELRQVVVHSQERTSWIPPDKRATEKLQRQREIERYDAPKELPSSAPQQSRHSPSSKILIRSSQHSPLYINEQQSHRNQPVATQPDPVLPSQFYAPSQPRVGRFFQQNPSQVMHEQSQRTSINEIPASNTTNGLLSRPPPPPPPLVPIQRSSPEVTFQRVNREVFDRCASSNPDIRNAEKLRMPRS